MATKTTPRDIEVIKQNLRSSVRAEIDDAIDDLVEKLSGQEKDELAKLESELQAERDYTLRQQRIINRAHEVECPHCGKTHSVKIG